MTNLVPKNGQLDVLLRAQKALEEARTVPDIKRVRDRAEAVRTYAKTARLGLDVVNKAAEIRLRAERKAGEILRDLCLRGGDRKSKGRGDRLVLEDLGLTQNDSKRWQEEASISDELFNEYLASCQVAGEIVNAAALRRFARRVLKTSVNGDEPTAASMRHIKAPGRPAATEPPRQQEVLSVIGEIENHLSTAASIIAAPLSEHMSAKGITEQRALTRYVREIQGLLCELKQLLK